MEVAAVLVNSLNDGAGYDDLGVESLWLWVARVVDDDRVLDGGSCGQRS